MDISEDQRASNLKGASKLFRERLQEQTWEFQGIPKFVTITHRNEYALCKPGPTSPCPFHCASMTLLVWMLSSCLNMTSELFGCLELSGVRKYRRLSDVQMDFGFSFDAAPTIDTVLYFKVSEMSEMNKDEIEIDR